MNKYESVIIVKPNLSKGKFDEISANIKNKISSYAMNIQMEDLGEKTLAYEIRKNKKGHYLISTLFKKITVADDIKMIIDIDPIDIL